MCGISGIFGHSPNLNPERIQALLDMLCEKLKHRGPDAVGYWVESNGYCGLGHRRLAIIDLDSRSNQPMLDASRRFVLTYNGEIYNFHVLRKELESLGYPFRTASDTEVLVAGYVVWGCRVFERLDGMFALAIFDTQTQNIILARDRTGEKPLYVARTGGYVAFSSEFKPLLKLPELPDDISEASLYEYFRLRYIASPNTLYKAISCVQPGTYQIFHPNGDWKECSYFSYDLPCERPLIGDDNYLDSLEAALTEAVRTRLIADVPVGAFLSSGVDSSLVCGIAARQLNSGIRCFGAGFANTKDNETRQAIEIAEYYGLPFEEYLVSENDLLTTASDFGTFLDEPNGDRSCVPTYFLSRLVRKKVKVAVSGDGGDELFGGYGRYAALRRQFRNDLSPLDAVCDYFTKALPVFPMDALRQALPGQEESFRYRFASRFISAFARRELDDIERMRLIDFHSYLPDAVLAKVDRMSMKHSLEVRTPFLAPSVMALSASLPIQLCERRGQLKAALRLLLERYLPADLIRRDKQGFGMPASFFKNHAQAFAKLAEKSDHALVSWRGFDQRMEAYELLKGASRSNINSYWAWIVLGQWVDSCASRNL